VTHHRSHIGIENIELAFSGAAGHINVLRQRSAAAPTTGIN